MPAVIAKNSRRAAKRPAKRAHLAADESWPLKEPREEWLRNLRAEYTPEVCAQTVALNESLPVHGAP